MASLDDNVDDYSVEREESFRDIDPDEEERA